MGRHWASIIVYSFQDLKSFLWSVDYHMLTWAIRHCRATGSAQDIHWVRKCSFLQSLTLLIWYSLAIHCMHMYSIPPIFLHAGAYAPTSSLVFHEGPTLIWMVGKKERKGNSGGITVDRKYHHGRPLTYFKDSASSFHIWFSPFQISVLLISWNTYLLLSYSITALSKRQCFVGLDS